MKLKIMTFNIRCKNDNDGINVFENRKDNILNTISSESPDIIGFQEVTDVQRAFLLENISDKYTVLGCGRGTRYHGESVSVAFKKDVFDLVSFETFWLSDTPNVPGSFYQNSDQSKCPRLTVHAELIAHGISTSPIHFFNTHLDHVGENARLLGMKQIMEKISACDNNFVLTGDFNANPDEACIIYAKTECGPNVTEATEAIPHTFHGFGMYDSGRKIDYIFTSGKPIEAYAVADAPENGIYISDHYPVCATLEIE